jgi:hypothetical protein
MQSRRVFGLVVAVAGISKCSLGYSGCENNRGEEAFELFQKDEGAFQLVRSPILSPCFS